VDVLTDEAVVRGSSSYGLRPRKTLSALDQHGRKTKSIGLTSRRCRWNDDTTGTVQNEAQDVGVHILMTKFTITQTSWRVIGI